LAAVITGCFIEPRSDKELLELLGVPILSDVACEMHSDCDDGNVCTEEECTYVGYCVYNPLPKGISCGQNGDLSCDDHGMCTGCGGDASKCPTATFCGTWSCPEDACVSNPEPFGLVLPKEDQVLGDCAVKTCNGNGAIFDDTASVGSACDDTDCVGLAEGAWCGAPECREDTNGNFSVAQKVCVSGSCSAAAAVLVSTCDSGAGCAFGECRSNCDFQNDCAVGALCEDGVCVPPRCDLICAASEALGCSAAPFPAPCEDTCKAVVADNLQSCNWGPAPYLHCLQKLPETAGCAERASSCAAELGGLLICQGADLRTGLLCGQILGCTTAGGTCGCADFCSNALYADHCVPSVSVPGAFDCTCAKDGVLVATCEAISGCGIETGCCASFF
jgi:hypothetical protein